MRGMSLTAEHEEFRGSVQTFILRYVIPRFDGFIEKRNIDREVWIEAGRQGYLGLDVPVEFNGSGAGDYRFNAILTEELAGVSMGLASCFGIHFDCVAPYLVDLGTDEQKSRWLPGFCAGELVSAIAMTEPSGGSDLANLRTTAVRSGSDWLLNGSKTFITNGISADLVIVAARTNQGKRAGGISLFVVEGHMQGFERGRKLDKVGQPESDTGELFFDDVRLPQANLLGEVDQGFGYMMQRLSQERMGSAVGNTAHARRALDMTLEYAKGREAFGQAIGSFQHSKFLLAELSTKLDVTQCYVDRCVEEHANGSLTPVDAAKAKWWSSEVQNEVLDACVQLHGGYGYMREYPITQAWLDGRVTKIWGGSNEIMKELIGRSMGL